MLDNHETKMGPRWALSVAGALLCLTKTNVASSQAPFDLAVEDISVKQVSSTPMFRTVEITCMVQNLGPGPSKATASVVFSRPGEDGPKVLKAVPIPRPLEPGATFQAQAQGSTWATASVPYRCQIQFSGAFATGDENSDNNAAELTFPKT